MARARTLTLKTKVEVTGADKLNNLGQKLQSTGKVLSTAVTLPILGLGAAIASAAEEAAQADAELRRTFDSMGAAAWTTVDALKEQQSALQDITTFGDEEISHAQSVLLTFGNVTGDAFTRATETAADMSALLGQDLQSSVVQLGKALNDPIRGVTALRRVGVSFTEQQLEQIRVLQESGDLMGAQTVILDELKREFGGAAEAMAGTAGGQFKQAMNALGDAGEEFGAVLAPVIKDIAQGIKDFAGWLRKLNPETKEWVVRIAALAAALGPVLIVVGSLARGFGALKGAGSALVNFAPKIGAAFTAMTGPIGLVVAAVSALALGFATDFLGMRTRLEHDINDMALNFGDLGDKTHQLADDMGISFDEAKQLILDSMEETGRGAENAIRGIRGTLREELSPALKKAGDDWEAYHGAISYNVDAARRTVQTGVDGMAEDIGELPEKSAQELLDNQFHLDDAITQLVEFMDQALSPAQEVFNARAFLASQEYRDGLNSGIPAVRLKAQELGQAAQDTIARYSNGYGAGYSMSSSFAAGMTDPAVINYVKQSAYKVALAARGIFPGSEPDDPNSPFRGITKGFGFGQVLAKGLLVGQSAVQGAFRSLVGGGLSMPRVGALASAPIAGGSGGTVINNFYLQWDGESPKGRSEAEIISNLQRLLPMTGGWQPGAG